ncbi:MAG TPA: N-acetylmuramoyl-L-alanine amidase [bacterium]|nr:N-acetylmuramoyl-L-alanine amidase [bacterium]
MKIKLTTYIVIAFFFIPSILFATLSGKKICVDPGHGGSDPGATGTNGSALPNEADLVLDVDLRLQSMLTDDSATVVMTRNDDVAVSLENRVAIANNASVTIFVSTHLNSSDLASANGTETFAYQPGGNSQTLATKIQNELLDHLGRTNRGVKYSGFYVIKNTTMPAALSEGLFVSNTTEFNLISQAATRQEHALGVYHAICSYFGVTPKDDPGTGTEDKVEVKGFVFNATQGENVEGNRIAGADCYLKKTGETDLHVVSSATGLFTFTNVTPGDYTLEISKTGFNTASKSVPASGNPTWASTGLTESTGGTETAWIKGFVFNDSTGLGNVAENRVANATCVLKKTVGGAEVTVTTDDSGFFRFNDLEPADYTLTVSKTGFVTTSDKPLTLIAGENWASTGIAEQGAVELGGLSGTVTSKTSYLAIAGAQCVITSKTSGDPYTVYSDETGKYEFTDIIPDDYTLAVSADGYEKWTGDVTVMTDQNAVKDVELTPLETANDDDTAEIPDENETVNDTDVVETVDNETPDESVIDPDDDPGITDSDETDDSIWDDFGEIDEEVGCGCSFID